MVKKMTDTKDEKKTEKGPKYHRHKLTHGEHTVLKKGVELLAGPWGHDVTAIFGEEIDGLTKLFNTTDYFIVVYTTGRQSRRKRRKT